MGNEAAKQKKREFDLKEKEFCQRQENERAETAAALLAVEEKRKRNAEQYAMNCQKQKYELEMKSAKEKLLMEAEVKAKIIREKRQHEIHLETMKQEKINNQNQMAATIDRQNKEMKLKEDEQQARIAQDNAKMERETAAQTEKRQVEMQLKKAKLQAKIKQEDVKLKMQKDEQQARIDQEKAKLQMENNQKMAKLELKREQKRRENIMSTLVEYNKIADDYQSKKNAAVKSVSELSSVISESTDKCRKMKADIEQSSNKKKIALESVNIKLKEARQNFLANDNEVRAVINKTCVHSDHVSDFLKLTANLIPITMKTAQETNNLGACFDNFYELISRECSDDMPIINYFAEKKIERFVPTLVANEMYILEDLECEDDKEFQQDIIEVLKSAIKVAKEQMKNDEIENDMAKDLSRMEKKKLKKVCRNPQIWQKYQKEKAAVNKRILKDCSPPMMHFFERTHYAMIQAGKLLEIGYEYNAEQQLALQGSIQSLSIEAPPNKDFEIEHESAYFMPNTDGNDDDSKYEAEVPGHPMENEELIENTIVAVSSSNLQLAGVVQDNALIQKCVITSIHVMSTMMKEFEISDDAKTFAMNIESTCEKLVRAQCSLRGNVNMAMAITKLKPAYMTKEAKVLWKAVDKGCIRIFESALEIFKVTSKYFSFFLRFKNSFGRYMKAMEVNENCPFMVSLEFLRKDLRDFKVFKDKYDKRLTHLNDSAMECISECVQNAIGGKNFETTQRNWKNSQEIYLEWQERYRKAESIVDAKYDEICNEKSTYEAEIAKNKVLLQNAQFALTSWIKKIGELDVKTENAQKQLLQCEKSLSQKNRKAVVSVK